MEKNTCSACDHDKNAPDGICLKWEGSDGLPVRCVGEWSDEKFYYLARYIDVFTKSMRDHPNWSGLCYVDLFAGPGLCRLREPESEISSSPLIALRTGRSFNKLFFVDLNPVAIETLRSRTVRKCEELGIDFSESIALITGDCNKHIDQIRGSILPGSLSLGFIDPTGLQFEFSTLEKLADGGIRIDLIINFPHSAIRRVISHPVDYNIRKMDMFWGDNSWSSTLKRLPKRASDELFTLTFISEYRKKLVKLGFQETKIGTEVGIRNLYYLLFASKHPLGNKFWREVIKIPYNRQGSLEFGNEKD